MDQATALGRAMALGERKVIPQLRFAHEYPDYVDYVQFHRHLLEQAPAFGAWDEKLRALTDRQGKSLGFNLNDSLEWDDFYLYIAVPLRASFWWGWERRWHLHELHGKWNQHIKSNQPKNEAGQRVLHVFMKGLGNHIEGEKDPWEAITNRLFEQQGSGIDEGDESFWSLPEVERIGTKAEETANS